MLNASVRERDRWTLAIRMVGTGRAAGRPDRAGPVLLDVRVVREHLVGDCKPYLAGDGGAGDREQFALLALEAQRERGAETLDREAEGIHPFLIVDAFAQQA